MQYVRVEVSEGRAYTYQSYIHPPLIRGEIVVLPANLVQAKPFTGKVVRILPGPDPTYDGPYKTIISRASSAHTLI